MFHNGNLKKVAKIFILVFLCSEMESSYTQQSAMDNLSRNYISGLNGYEAAQEKARHQASIRLKMEDKVFGDGHICSGAVIAPSVVLTVAQCIFDHRKQTLRHPAELKVVMGNVNRYQRTPHTLVYGVTHVYQPHIYNPQLLRGNLVIVMLERDIPETHPTVKPITLNVELPEFTDAKELTFEVTSWGATEQGHPIGQLISLNASISSAGQCLGNALDTFCANFHTLDVEVENFTCPRDMGAPMLHQNVLWGLSAHSTGCKALTAPAIYTDVAYHAKWILDKIGNGRNQNSSIWGTTALLLFTLFALKTSRFFKF